MTPINPKGTAVNIHGLSIPVYVSDDTPIIGLRNNLRKAFGTVLDYKEHAAVWDEILWINIMRFTSQPSKELLDFIKSQRDLIIGEYTIDRWEIYQTSSKVLAPEESSLIHTFQA